MPSKSEPWVRPCSRKHQVFVAFLVALVVFVTIALVYAILRAEA